jgi:hypothetical protein
VARVAHASNAPAHAPRSGWSTDVGPCMGRGAARPRGGGPARRSIRRAGAAVGVRRAGCSATRYLSSPVTDPTTVGLCFSCNRSSWNPS